MGGEKTATMFSVLAQYHSVLALQII